MTDRQIAELSALALLENRSKGAVIRRMFDKYMTYVPEKVSSPRRAGDLSADKAGK